ncbi:MAG: ATP-grasp domain-containing protein [Gemmatimonadaceae bacterium]|nr:ATP-grasp domain-containing protein [Gemmatimonadaceae bacterium]
MGLVLFVTPHFSETFSRMLAGIGAIPGVTLGVITHAPAEDAPAPVRDVMRFHWKVADILNPAQIVWGAEGIASQAGMPIHRLFGSLEQAQVPIAEARERLGVGGMSAAATRNFRDKAEMKRVLRANGIPCARHALATTLADVDAAVATTGFPLVVKPPAGAGSIATFRVNDRDQLASVLANYPPSLEHPLLFEEFVQGEEHSLETISIAGVPVWHSLTHYRPTPLDVVRHPWIQWCITLPREVDDPRYDDIKRAAAGGLAALGMGTGLSHMEWFRRADGTVAIGEVGARPPGAQITTMISRANDIDFVRAWAEVMVHGRFVPPVRKYAVGAAFLRGQGSGRVRAVHGLETVAREVGALVCDWRLPQVGQLPTGSYEGEGYILVRHPETSVVEDALNRIVSRIRVELG